MKRTMNHHQKKPLRPEPKKEPSVSLKKKRAPATSFNYSATDSISLLFLSFKMIGYEKESRL